MNKNAKRWLWLLLPLSLILTVVVIWLMPTREQNHSLSDITLTSLEGQQVRPADFEGQPVIINLWATWCQPCTRELPLLAEMDAQYPQVQVLFVNQRERQSQVKDYLEAQGLDLNWVLLDPEGKLASSYQSRGLPTTLFFDTQGELVEAFLGELSMVQLFNAIQDLRP
nr:thioredoxin [uncultured bacterium]